MTAGHVDATAARHHLILALDVSEALAGLLVRHGLTTTTDIAAAPLARLEAVGVISEATATELKARAVEHLTGAQPEPAETSTSINAPPPVAGNAVQAPPTPSTLPASRSIPSVSKAAERMRESRQRRRRGMKCFTIELRDTEISELVQRRLLDGGKRADSNAILEALYRHLDATLKASSV